jgi:hypothetical protein
MKDKQKPKSNTRLSLDNPKSMHTLLNSFKAKTSKHYKAIPKGSLICNKSTPTGFRCLTCENTSSIDSSI